MLKRKAKEIAKAARHAADLKYLEEFKGQPGVRGTDLTAMYARHRQTFHDGAGHCGAAKKALGL